MTYYRRCCARACIRIIHTSSRYLFIKKYRRDCTMITISYYILSSSRWKFSIGHCAVCVCVCVHTNGRMGVRTIILYYVQIQYYIQFLYFIKPILRSDCYSSFSVVRFWQSGTNTPVLQSWLPCLLMTYALRAVCITITCI